MSTTPTTWSATSRLRRPAPASPVEILAGLGHRLRGHVDDIRPRLATTDERRLLSLPQVSVVLELARTAHTADGTPVVVLHQVRRGDGATFSTRSATQAGNCPLRLMPGAGAALN